ncbi:hypothetical protein ACFSOZ_05135 [Mesorhizobium newzealandense]|uniref:Cohesin domain-containing protein n=1 Tax=Mesorhizobium newzealandense TaxID=1300302 RepID=A0ABW4U7K3_9HYPH
MASVVIVRVETPEGNAVRGGDPVTVSVTIDPSDTGWFDDKKDLVIGFVYAANLAITAHLKVHGSITIIDNITITFKVSAKADALLGEYYVIIKNTKLNEIVISDSNVGTITVS